MCVSKMKECIYCGCVFKVRDFLMHNGGLISTVPHLIYTHCCCNCKHVLSLVATIVLKLLLEFRTLPWWWITDAQPMHSSLHGCCSLTAGKNDFHKSLNAPSSSFSNRIVVCKLVNVPRVGADLVKKQRTRLSLSRISLALFSETKFCSLL